MGVWGSISCNRMAEITSKQASDIEKHEKLLKKIGKKYAIIVETRPYNEDQSTAVILKDANQEKFSTAFYDSEIYKLPLFRIDDDFEQRTEDFIKEASSILSFLTSLEFREPAIRMATFS